jgi:tRNA nucleotidyltransferase (CCA-adding enzyme)
VVFSKYNKLRGDFIRIPENVKLIIDKLENKGFQAFIVGGSVRDTLLGNAPKDWDVTTNAIPEQILEVFSDFKTLEVGMKFGTIIVVIDQEQFEVTTFRCDGISSDNRKPDSVKFVSNIQDDLSRRDLTINAMAWNENVGFIDPFGGRFDLQSGLIRTVGNPNDRFKEDGLRIMRSVRFAIRFNFDIESETFEAIQNNVCLLNNISKERIHQELVNILKCENLNRLELLHTSKILSIVIPELDNCFNCNQNNPHHIFNVGKHIIEATKKCTHDWDVRLAVLLHDIGKPLMKTTKEGIDHFIGHDGLSSQMAKDILQRLKFDTITIEKVCSLINFHDTQLSESIKSTKRLLNKVGSVKILIELLAVKKADALAQNQELSSEKLDLIKITKTNVFKIMEDNQCFKVKDLKISGKDIMETLNIKPGILIGQLLEKCLDVVIEGDVENTKENLIRFVKSL